ncbi:Aldehyde dehydrogenase [Kalmanozyma brasiliensis GHG001]|uniref:Aldehyde dehydrogenase n=1 Tax=Kalmanozyma brasiliensis (strain GHG001) TaxID=1365824 RepID=V5GHE0_KALBG|nr:Aldehyde dehydrogenase [Kalmanozyma brasiliensis GHG001]EST05427.1 Aldehyde dehydrogenase [Kalmanozyma brasiliensis GHG001]
MAISSTLSIASPSGKTLTVPTGLFIDNAFVPSVTGDTLETINPATGASLGHVSAGSAEDVDLAVSAARTAYNTVWGRNSTPSQRAECLFKLASLLEEHIVELSELESLDNGKPRWIAETMDIADTAGCFRYYAGLADKIEGKTIEQKEGEKLAFTRLEPLGVCGQIIPWNYPIGMLGWKVAPALAAGNCVVLKPAEQTPLTALKIAELAVEAGLPKGVFNVVNGLGPVVGDAITGHMDVDKVAFTGSTAIGKRVMQRAAQSNLKKVTLELGGKSPVVVFDDADIDQAVNWVALGILFNQGQDCTAGSRLFVQEGIYDKFLPKLVAAFKAHTIGDPFDSQTFQGPQITQRHQQRILDYIESGKAEGAKVEIGGGAWTEGTGDFAKGFYVQPTIFSGCKRGMKIVDEEIFGPVLAVASFKDEAEAIKLANDTSYGLGAGVFSSNANTCMRVSGAIQAGTVWVNNYVVVSNAVPFGGFKSSGIGRELGVDAIKEYTQVKSVHWNFGEMLDWPLTG